MSTGGILGWCQPIGSMYGIYMLNDWVILMGSMLPYIAAPWILWAMGYALNKNDMIQFFWHCELLDVIG